MNRREFKVIMSNIKDRLERNQGHLATCNALRQACRSVALFYCYDNFIQYHLSKSRMFLSYGRRGAKLKPYEPLMRRYLILDAFEHEVLATKKYKEF